MNIGDRFVSADDPAVECVVVWTGGREHPLMPTTAIRLGGSSLEVPSHERRAPREGRLRVFSDKRLAGPA